MAEADAGRVAATPAVRLLLDRARASDPRLDVTPDNADTLGRIVRMLDGLPLALEIVAPWLRPLTPDGVLEQLQRPLDIAGRGIAEARHRTLRDTIAWSSDRLSSEQRNLLACLSVLRGSGDLDAITAIAGPDLERPVVDVLVDLVDRNLVQPAPPLNRRPRFRMLVTIRHFAADQLEASGHTAAVAARATDHYARWAVDLARHSEGPDTSAWLEQAIADSDNLRAAIDHLEAAGRSEEHLQLVVDAMVLWFEAGHEHEGERRLRAALARAPASPTRAIALAYLAWLVGTHDRSEAAELARQAVDLARRDGDRPVLAFALQTLGETVDDLDDAVGGQHRGRPARGRARRRSSRHARSLRADGGPGGGLRRGAQPRRAVDRPLPADGDRVAAAGAGPRRDRGRPAHHRRQPRTTGAPPSAWAVTRRRQPSRSIERPS